MSDHERTEQQRAALEGERDVFLRAGAGTGKTTVLVDRFCAAALDPEVGTERILAFTFTERAADQLRHRIRDELGRRARDASGQELEALRTAREATERAWISTIHGFCRRLLAMHPAAAGIDPRFRVLDEPEADRLATRAFDAALEELVDGGDPEALELAAANRRRTLLEMTRGAYDELRSHGEPAPALPEAPPADPAPALTALIESAREAHEECAEASGKAVRSRERIGVAAELDPAEPPSEELLERLRGLDILSKAGPLRGEACERYTRNLKLARSAVASHVLGPAYAQLRLLVEGFGGHYERLKEARSALDFEDLQLQAVALLEGSEPLRERYRDQFRHLLVDEFQDTNQLQLRLVGQLRGPDTRLFLVGDEFQSIYGFRHADVDVYRSEYARFAEGGEPRGVALPLTGNFRAAPELVAATNAIGSALLDGFEPLTAAVEPPAGDGPGVEMLLTVDDRKGWEAEETELSRLEDDPSSGSKVAEARLLAARLREIADAGEDPAEIVVLLRAFTHVNTIERALGEAGLDPYVVGGRGFWSQQQIEDLRCLLAVVDNPLGDQELFGALASPACGALPDTLWLLRRAATTTGENGRERANHIWPLLRELDEQGAPSEGEGDAEAAALIADDERERLLAFTRTLTALRARGAEGGLEALVDRVATGFDYDLATLARDDGPARWSNARKLMRIAREFEAREGPDLTAFLEYLDTRAAQRDREAEAASRAEGHAGVRVMTVHSAKGLEFGVVAAADLGRSLQLGWTPLRVAPADEGEGGEAARVGVQLGRLGRPGERLHDYEELTERATEREAEEEGRLAYVAATRAKRRLLLSGTFSPSGLGAEPVSHKPITHQLIRSLLDGEPSEGLIEVPAAGKGAPSGRIEVRLSEPGPGAGAALLAAPATTPPPPATGGGDAPLGRPATPPALIGGLSYSALSAFSRCGYRFYVERVLGIAQPGEPGALGENGEGSSPEARTRFGPGLAVHALLEWSARNGWRDPGEERAAAALREHGLDDAAEVERALGAVRAFLDSPFRGEIDAGKASPEVPFVLSVAGTLVRGSIDLLVERPDGSVLVVDYKSDRLRGRGAEQAAGRYQVQRDLYALAAAARGVPVETAYVFLERPDSPIRQTFDDDGLDQARSGIEALLARLSAASFEVTHHPHRALCHDCPARERLCSHETTAMMRDDPDPPLEPAGPRAHGDQVEDDTGGPQLTLLDR